MVCVLFRLKIALQGLDHDITFLPCAWIFICSQIEHKPGEICLGSFEVWGYAARTAVPVCASGLSLILQ